MTNSEQHMKAALDSGVTPDQFRAEYEKRQSTAVSHVCGHHAIRHVTTASGCLSITTFDHAHDTRQIIALSPASAIRWGESLAAAGRAAQK